jgi:hypothetical protein
MYKNLTKDGLLQLNGKTLTEKEYFLDLLNNPLITKHEFGLSNSYKVTSHWVTIDDEIEIFIKVKRRN